MSEKALVIMVFMYCTSFAMLGAQYVIADVIGTTLTSPVTGQQIKSALIGGNGTSGIINLNTLNLLELNATSNSRTNTVNNPIGTAASMAWEVMQILTGTYIFNILSLLGVPTIFIAGMVVVYVFFLIRAILAYLRGI